MAGMAGQETGYKAGGMPDNSSNSVDKYRYFNRLPCTPIIILKLESRHLVNVDQPSSVWSLQRQAVNIVVLHRSFC